MLDVVTKINYSGISFIPQKIAVVLFEPLGMGSLSSFLVVFPLAS